MSYSQHALLSLFLFAILNITLSKYFSHVEPMIAISIYCYTVATLSLICVIYKHTANITMVTPDTTVLLIMFIWGVCYFFAELSYFTAYNKGGEASLPTITTIVGTMPVFATIIKMGLDRKLPSLSQFLGCILAALAVYLVTRK